MIWWAVIIKHVTSNYVCLCLYAYELIIVAPLGIISNSNTCQISIFFRLEFCISPLATRTCYEHKHEQNVLPNNS